MTTDKNPRRTFQCLTSARWLPRVTAVAVLLTALLVSFRFQAWGTNPGGSSLRLFLLLVGGAMAFWVLKSGAEVRLKVDLGDDDVHFSYGRQMSGLKLADIDRFEFDHPMTASRRLLPATVLVDEKGRAWRLPSVLESGADLIEAIIERSGREDLQAWADSLSLRARMDRAGVVTAVGYVGAALILASGVWFYLH